MTASLRVAIAGAAHPHVGYLTAELDRNPAYRLVAVADPDRDTAARWAAPYGAAVHTDHRRMLDTARPDAVLIAGVYGDRGAAAVDALDAGCHVLADKPLCTTLAELDRIEHAARRARRHVVLLLEKRYYPVTLAALDLVRDGALGTVTGVASAGPHKLNRPSRPDWFFDPARYGGLLNDLAVHDLDAALLFTGMTAGTVAGTVAGPLPDAPGFATCGTAVLAGGGRLATAGVDWLTPAGSPLHGDYRMTLTGTRGTADLRWARNRLVLTTDRAAPHDVALPPGRRPAELPLRALAEGREPDISTAAGLLATRLALTAQRSAAEGGTPVPWSADAPSP